MSQIFSKELVRKIVDESDEFQHAAILKKYGIGKSTLSRWRQAAGKNKGRLDKRKRIIPDASELQARIDKQNQEIAGLSNDRVAYVDAVSRLEREIDDLKTKLRYAQKAIYAMIDYKKD